MRSLSVAALLLLLMVVNVHCRALNNGVNEEFAAMDKDIKRLLELLEKRHNGNEESNQSGNEKRPQGSKDEDRSESEEEEDPDEPDAIIKHEQVQIQQMEAFLQQERNAVPAGAIDPNETDETKLHNRIQQLEEEIRRDEDTVHIRNGKVTKIHRTKLDDVFSLHDSDDIVYTPEQLADMQSKMGKRRVIQSLSWPDKVIPYEFDSSFSQSSSQAAVVNAMQEWESVSCISFRPRVSTDTDYYLRILAGNGCSSYVGRVKIGNGGQPVKLHDPGCIYKGTILHELGHAMGFFHEQSRQDRDDSVTINYENIQSGREHNFNLAQAELLTKYDVESVMHYSSHDFSKNGLTTIDAKEDDENVLMGNRAFLTFYDKKVANLAYQCADHCDSSAPVCANEGYLNKKCACVCPKGLGGPTCETVDPTWSNTCGGVFSLDDGDELTLETPGFPGVYPPALKCAWFIESKRNDSIVTLKILTLNNEYLGSCSDTLEIRKNLPGQTGLLFCGSNPNVVPDANSPLFTITNKPGTQSMSVLFESSPTSQGMAKGFKAIAKIAKRYQSACAHITCPGESNCVDHGSLVSHTCVCKVGWSGSDCSTNVTTTGIVTDDFESTKSLFDIVEPWRRKQGSTTSSSTGPTGDYTTGAGYYAYFESSSPVQNGEMHQMISSDAIFDAGYERCMSFAYNMNGNGMGTLEVKLEIDGQMVTAPLFSESGAQGSDWILAIVVIPVQSGATYRIVFEATRGSSYRSDIALDDISLGPCGALPSIPPTAPITTPPAPITTPPALIPSDATIIEDFDGNTYAFDVMTDNYQVTRWRLGSGSTPSIGTGPDHDYSIYSKGSYAYFEASSPAVNNDAAIMRSYAVFTGDELRCLSFAFHMRGSGLGSLDVGLAFGGQPQAPLFKASGDNYGQNWNLANVFIPKQQSSYTIEFIATRGTSWQSDIAVDAIKVSPCPVQSSTPSTSPSTTPSTSPSTTPSTSPSTTPTSPSTTSATLSSTSKTPRTFGGKPWITVFGNDVMCDFEEDLADCFISNSRKDTTDFVRADQCLGTTSPCSDHTSGFGYYLIFRPQLMSSYDRGTLVGPWLTLESREICVGGYFQGAGSCSASLIIEFLSLAKADNHVPILLSNTWHEEQLTYVTQGEVFRVLIVAEVHNDSSASVSLDDLYIRSGSC